MKLNLIYYKCLLDLAIEEFVKCYEDFFTKDQDRYVFGLNVSKKKLYDALEERLKAQGIRNLYACIAVPPKKADEYLTFDSMKFHKKMGFKLAGHFHACGKKFDRWYDMVYMEKII